MAENIDEIIFLTVMEVLEEEKMEESNDDDSDKLLLYMAMAGPLAGQDADRRSIRLLVLVLSKKTLGTTITTRSEMC